MKVVVFVKNGAVQKIVTDCPGVQVLVLDSDTEGCDQSSMVEVRGQSYALDAMEQALPKVSKDTTDKVFCAMDEAIDTSPENALLVKIAKALKAANLLPLEQLTPEDLEGIQAVFRAVGIPRVEFTDGVLKTQEGVFLCSIRHADDPVALCKQVAENYERHQLGYALTPMGTK